MAGMRAIGQKWKNRDQFVHFNDGAELLVRIPGVQRWAVQPSLIEKIGDVNGRGVYFNQKIYYIGSLLALTKVMPRLVKA